MGKTDLLRDKFQHELSEENKNILAKAFIESCKQILQSGSSIFLETYGIFSNVIEKKTHVEVYEGKTLRRDIKTSSISFQKCSELTSFIREKVKKIAEEKELFETIFSKLPIRLQISWKLDKTKEYVSGLIQSIKHDTVTLGICKLITELGDFYSMHNRQGMNLDDWYSGANIVFRSNFNTELSCENCSIYERPLLQGAWELMNCIYGNAIHVFSINVHKELKNLGFELDRSYFGEGIEQENIQVAVYANKSSNQQQLIYCTEGLRNLGVEKGSELIFQVAYDADFRDSAKNSSYKLDDILLPDWPKTAILMGWIMIQNSKDKCAKPGAALSFNTKLCNDLPQSKLSAVICTTFAQSKCEQLTPERPFTFINLLGITNDEYRLAEDYAGDVLITLLKNKRLDQVTKLCRPNLLTKTAFLDMSAGKVQKAEHQIQENKQETRAAS